MPNDEVTLLLVDDDEIDRETIIRYLKRVKAPTPVATAGDGVEALDMLRGTNGATRVPRPVVVLLDWKMPRMNGLEFLEDLRADPELRETVVFVHSTSGDEVDVRNAYRHLVAGYIVKDSSGRDFGQLVDMLDKYRKVVEIPN